MSDNHDDPLRVRPGRYGWPGPFPVHVDDERPRPELGPLSAAAARAKAIKRLKDALAARDGYQ